MLSVVDIHKMYEGKSLLRGISFNVHKGETICLLGHSGSGKSTLLRIIAGIEQPDHGNVFWDGENLLNIPIHKRNFGLMFQDYALFPHKNVFENVAFGLRMINFPASQIKDRVIEELTKVKMLQFANRSVAELSGGEQQRVALARALAPQPKLLMLDEPLGALDKTLRGQLIKDIRALLHETEIPAIYVTHDQEEAFTIGDQLALLHNGEISQFGTPKSIYQNPKNTWVARFLGLTNIIGGEVISINPISVKTNIGVFSVTSTDFQNFSINQPVELLIRPNAVETGKQVDNHITGRVIDSVFLGQGFRIIVDNGVNNFEFDVSSEFFPGQKIDFSIDPDLIHCFSIN